MEVYYGYSSFTDKSRHRNKIGSRISFWFIRIGYYYGHKTFLRQAINQQRIPFDIVPPKYNFSEETHAAIDEARKISKDPSIKSYTSAKELFEDCE